MARPERGVSTWPKCPTCKSQMWLGQIGAPVRIIYGCSHCDIRIDETSDTVELVLFKEAS